MILTKCIMFHYLTIRLQYIWQTMTLPLTIRLLWFYNLHFTTSIKSVELTFKYASVNGMKGRLIVGWVFRLFVGWWLTIKSEVYLPHQTEPQKYNNEPDPNYKIPSAQHKSLWQGEKSWKHRSKFPNYRLENIKKIKK